MDGYGYVSHTDVGFYILFTSFIVKITDFNNKFKFYESIKQSYSNTFDDTANSTCQKLQLHTQKY